MKPRGPRTHREPIIQVGMRFPKVLHDEIEALAQRKYRSFTAQVMYMLQQALDREKEV